MQKWHHAVSDTSRELAGVPRISVKSPTGQNSSSSSSSSPRAGPTSPSTSRSAVSKQQQQQQQSSSSSSSAYSTRATSPNGNNVRVGLFSSSNIANMRRSTPLSDKQQQQQQQQQREGRSGSVSNSSSSGYGQQYINNNNDRRATTAGTDARTASFLEDASYDGLGSVVAEKNTSSQQQQQQQESHTFFLERFLAPLSLDQSPLSQATMVGEVARVLEAESNAADTTAMISEIRRGYSHAQRKDKSEQDSTIFELTEALGQRNEALKEAESIVHSLRTAENESAEYRARARQAELELVSTIAMTQERVGELERQLRDAERRADASTLTARRLEDDLTSATFEHKRKLLEATTTLQAQITAMSVMLRTKGLEVDALLGDTNAEYGIDGGDGASQGSGRNTPIADEEDAPDDTDEAPAPLGAVTSRLATNHQSARRLRTGSTSSKQSDSQQAKMTSPTPSTPTPASNNNTNNTTTTTTTQQPSIMSRLLGRRGSNSSHVSANATLEAAATATNNNNNRRGSTASYTSAAMVAATLGDSHNAKNAENAASIISRAIEEAVTARMGGGTGENHNGLDGSRISEFEEKIALLTLHLARAEKDAADAHADALSARGERDALHGTVGALKAASFGTDILRTEIDELKSTLETVEKSCESYRAELKIVASERDVLHQTMGRLTAERDRLAALDVHVQSLEHQLRGAQQGGNNADHQAKLAVVEVETMKRLLEEEKAAAARLLQNTHVEHEAIVSSVKAEMGTLTAKVEESQRRLASVMMELESAKAELEVEKEAKRQEMMSRVAYVASASGVAQQMRQENETLKAEIESLKQSLTSAQTKMETGATESQHALHEAKRSKTLIENALAERDALRATLTAVKAAASEDADAAFVVEEKLKVALAHIKELEADVQKRKQDDEEVHETKRSKALIENALAERDALRATLTAVKAAASEDADAAFVVEEKLKVALAHIKELEADVQKRKQDEEEEREKRKKASSKEESALAKLTQEMETAEATISELNKRLATETTERTRAISANLIAVAERDTLKATLGVYKEELSSSSSRIAELEEERQKLQTAVQLAKQAEAAAISAAKRSSSVGGGGAGGGAAATAALIRRAEQAECERDALMGTVRALKGALK